MYFLQSISGLFRQEIAPSEDKFKRTDNRWKVIGPIGQLNDCPAEMICEIFCCLDKTEKALGRVVCKRWAIILKDNILWKDVFLERKEPLPTHEISKDYYFQFESFHGKAKLLQSHALKKEVSYEGDKSDLQKFFQLYNDEFYFKLHSLHLKSFSGLSKRSLIYCVEQLIKKCSNLKQIDFSHFDIDERVLMLAIGLFNQNSQNKSVVVLDSAQHSKNVEKVIKAMKNITLEMSIEGIVSLN